MLNSVGIGESVFGIDKPQNARQGIDLPQIRRGNIEGKNISSFDILSEA